MSRPAGTASRSPAKLPWPRKSAAAEEAGIPGPHGVLRSARWWRACMLSRPQRSQDGVEDHAFPRTEIPRSLARADPNRAEPGWTHPIRAELPETRNATVGRARWPRLDQMAASSMLAAAGRSFQRISPLGHRQRFPATCACKLAYWSAGSRGTRQLLPRGPPVHRRTTRGYRRCGQRKG